LRFVLDGSQEHERVSDLDHDALELLIERDRLWFKSVQPIKEFHEHFQRGLLAGFHRFAEVCLLTSHIWVILELEVPLLERDGVVEEEVRSVLENVWEHIPGEVLVQGGRGVGEQKGNVRRGSREDSGESGKGIVGTDCNTRDGAIGKNENSIDGVNVFPDLCLNTLPVELVSLKATSVG
jgi:hypothetical protein